MSGWVVQTAAKLKITSKTTLPVQRIDPSVWIHRVFYVISNSTLTDASAHLRNSVLALTGTVTSGSLNGSMQSLGQYDNAQNQRPHLILDFALVDTLDKAGIKDLLELARALHRLRGKLILTGLNSDLEASVRAAHLHTFIPILPDIESAQAYSEAL